MRQEAERCYPREACGLIVAIGKKMRFVACTNTSHVPNEQFVLAPEDWMRAADMGEVIALWHSHPNGNCQPSEADRAGCEASQVPWLISALVKDAESFTHFGPELTEPDGFKADYVGRPYVFGIFDCMSLVNDFYEREYGIQIERFPELRQMEWWRHGFNHFGDNYASQGFVAVTDDSWQEGDLLMFSVDSEVPNHVALYVTADIILHHVIGRLSRKDSLGGFWRSHLSHHLRHTTKC